MLGTEEERGNSQKEETGPRWFDRELMPGC